MAAAHFVFEIGQSNEDGVDGMAIADLQANYLDHNLKEPYIQPWITGTTYIVGVIRHSAGNEYALVTAGGGAASNAPTHGSGNSTGADGYTWKFLRAAQADIDARAVSTLYEVGEVKYSGTTTVRLYQCIVRGTTSATANITSTATDYLDGSCRWRYIGVFVTGSKKNILYTNHAKIWNIDTQAFVNLSLSARNVGIDTTIGIGPNLHIAAQMGLRWNPADCYIVKYTVPSTGLNAHASLNNWSADDYAAARGLLKLALDNLVTAINARITAGDTVTLEMVVMTQGEQDTYQSTWAYRYRANLQNLIARICERLSLADGTLPYFAWCQPNIHQGGTGLPASLYYSEFGYMVRAAGAQAITRIKAIHGNARADVIDTTANYESSDLAADKVHWNSSGQRKRINSVFAAYDAAVVAGYSGPTKSSGWSEDTTFDALPTFSVSSAPAATYSPGAAVTATLTASNFDGGYASSSIVWSCDDDVSVSATGLSLSVTPQKYNGLCLRAHYENAKHYCAQYYGWTHVLAPRSLTGLGTPKQWVRECLDVVLEDTTTLEINRALNHSGANSAYAWEAMFLLAGSPRAHHQGIALELTDALRALQFDGTNFTTDSASQIAASLTDTGDWVRFAKFRPRYANPTTNGTVYGMRGTSTAGGAIALEAVTNGSLTTMSVIGMRGATKLVPASGTNDIGDAGSDIVVAMRKSGNDFTLHCWNGSGVTVLGPVNYTGITDGSPDGIGWGSNSGIQGLVREVIGAQVAPSDGDIAINLAELAANDAGGAALFGDAQVVADAAPPILGNVVDFASAAQAAADAAAVLSTSIAPAGDASVVQSATGALTESPNKELRIRLKDAAGNSRYITQNFYQPADSSLAGAAGVVVGGAADFTTAIAVGGAAQALSVATGALAETANKELRIRLKDAAGNSRYITQNFYQPSYTALQAAAANEAGANGDLLTFTGLGGSAAVVAAAVGDLNTVTTVTLVDPLYTGRGSICDPRYWSAGAPKAGDIVAFETRDGFSIASNGEFSALVDSGEFSVQFFDGASIYYTTVVLSAYSGDAEVSATATADLSAGIALGGAAAVDAAVAAALTTAIQFAAAAAMQADSSAGIDTAISFDGSAQGQVDATGSAATAIPLDGVAQSAADATGDLSAGVGFAGAGAVEQSASAEFDTDIAMAADAAGNVSATANLSAGAGLWADAEVRQDGSGALGTEIPLAGGDGVEVDASGALDTSVTFDGIAPVEAAAGGAIDTAITMAGDALAEAGVSAPLTDQVIVGDYLVATSITLVPGGDVSAVPGMLPIYISNESRLSVTVKDGGGNPITSGKVEVTLYTKPSAEVSGITWPLQLSHEGAGVWSVEIDALSLLPLRTYVMQITAFAGQLEGQWRVRGDWRIACRAKYRGLRA